MNFGPFTYIWTVTPPDDEPISLYAGQSPTISFPAAGTYGLSVEKKSASCFSVMAFKSVIIQPFYGLLNIEVNPNPANNTVQVGYSGSDYAAKGKYGTKSSFTTSPVNLNVYDRFGTKVIELKGVSNRTAIVDVSSLRNGIYVVEIIDKKGRKGSTRLVVAR